MVLILRKEFGVEGIEKRSLNKVLETSLSRIRSIWADSCVTIAKRRPLGDTAGSTLTSFFTLYTLSIYLDIIEALLCFFLLSFQSTRFFSLTHQPHSHSHTIYFYPSYCTQRNNVLSTEHHNNQYILTIIKTGLIPRSTLILPSAVSPLDVSLWNYVPMSSPRLLKTFGKYVYFRYAYYVSFLCVYL